MALTIALDQVGLAPAGSSDPKENARRDGLPADVGGGKAAEISITLTGFPVGAALDVELMSVPQLPTPDTNIGTSPAETPVGSGVFKFTPDALRYGKFRIRATATRSGGIVEEVIRTFAFASPNKGLVPPAFNERGARDASLINQGDGVKARTEDNSGVAGGTVDAYYDWMIAMTKAVEEDVGGGFDIDQSIDTADASQTTIATYATLADESVIELEITVIVWAPDTVPIGAASFKIIATFTRNDSSVLVEEDAKYVHSFRSAALDALPQPDIDPSGTNIIIDVTGIAATDIAWRAFGFVRERQKTGTP